MTSANQLSTSSEPLSKTGSSKELQKALLKEIVYKDGLTLKTDIKRPMLRHDEIRIRVLATAVCGTDKSIYQSGHSEGIRNEMQRYLSDAEPYKPIIVGHEFAELLKKWVKVSSAVTFLRLLIISFLSPVTM